VPTPTKFTVEPETVHTVRVELPNVTVFPDPPPVAVTAYVPPNAAATGAVDVNVIAWLALNAAETFCAALIVTARVVVPVPSPLQTSNVDPAAVGRLALGVAVSVTAAPLAKAKLHVPEVVPAVLVQLIPAGLLVIVPTPAPDAVTVSVCVAGFTVSEFVPVDVAAVALAVTVAETPLGYVPTGIVPSAALLSVTLPPPLVVPVPTTVPLSEKVTVAPLTLPLGTNST
jgi:hypothetical protein